MLDAGTIKVQLLSLRYIWMLPLIAAGAGCGAFGAEKDNDQRQLIAALLFLRANTPIYMFSDANSSNAGHNGGLGGRSGADSKCNVAKLTRYRDLQCTNIHAFLSVNGGSGINQLPGNYGFSETVPILSPTGLRIAGSWGELFDGSISDTGSLQSAGLFPDIATPLYWTGTNRDNGATSGSRCCNWRNNEVVNSGYVVDARDNSGFSSAQLQTCDRRKEVGGSPISLVCICW